MTIIEKMQEDIFTDAEKQVVNYLLDHLDDFMNLSINDLAKKSYTSHATVIRVCHKLDIQGYRQFKILLLKELQANKFIVNKVDYTIPFQSHESVEEIMQNMYSLYQEGIQQVYNHLDIHILKKIAELFMMKKRIFIYAHGDSQITALSFINKLVKINIFPILATEYHEEYFISQKLQPSDFAFFISYSGESPSFLQCMQVLKQKGVQTALLTAHEKQI